MNVIHVNLKVNMGMNVSIHFHYGLFFSFIQFMDDF
jgi:hypothetical protein